MLVCMNRLYDRKCNILTEQKHDCMLLYMNRLNNKNAKILAHKSLCILVYTGIKE